MNSKDFFNTVNQINNVYRVGMGLKPLEQCDCGKPATYLGMCDSCYHSAQIASREEHSTEAYRRENDE